MLFTVFWNFSFLSKIWNVLDFLLKWEKKKFLSIGKVHASQEYAKLLSETLSPTRKINLEG